MAIIPRVTLAVRVHAITCLDVIIIPCLATAFIMIITCILEIYDFMYERKGSHTLHV